MSRTAAEVANYLGAALDGHPAARITGVANPEQARTEDLIYVESSRHAQRAEQSAAACVLCT
ncbi:MAG: hypothetical protein ACRD5F_08290, partial [Candidatus Acidiferrales bacterium]